MNYKNQKVMKLSNENQMMFNIVPLFGAHPNCKDSLHPL